MPGNQFRDMAFFVPTLMWGDTFRAILVAGGHSRFKRSNSIRPFPLGEDQQRHRYPHDDVRDMLKGAQQAYSKANNRKLPVIVMPLPLVVRYAAPDGGDDPDLAVLGPALKTRDDIFLFLVRRWGGPLAEGENHVVKVAMKGEDLTTTHLGELYKKYVIDPIADPLFDKPLGDLNGVPAHQTRRSWYDFVVDSPPELQPGETKDAAVLRSMSGQIVAGPSLERYWYNPEWHAAVNLNAWICRRLGVPYFVRAVFCTLPEAYEEATDRFEAFWSDFQKCGKKWSWKVHAACSRSHHACIGAKVVAPIQAPAVTGTEKFVIAETERRQNGAGGVDEREELVRDIAGCVRFLEEARDCKGSSFCGCRHFAPRDFRAVDRVVKWCCAARLATPEDAPQVLSELSWDKGKPVVLTPGVHPDNELRTRIFAGVCSTMHDGSENENMTALWKEGYRAVIEDFVLANAGRCPAQVGGALSHEQLAERLGEDFVTCAMKKFSGVARQLTADDSEHGKAVTRLFFNVTEEVCE